jgi:hypothetical protein
MVACLCMGVRPGRVRRAAGLVLVIAESACRFSGLQIPRARGTAAGLPVAVTWVAHGVQGAVPGAIGERDTPNLKTDAY